MWARKERGLEQKTLKVGYGEGSIQTGRVWGYWTVKEDQGGDAGDCVDEGLASYFLGTLFLLPSELLCSPSPGSVCKL